MHKVVLITGCSSGVGMQAAVLLAKKGLKVYASMRNLDKSQALEALIEQENVQSLVSIVKLDVQSEESIKATVETILKDAGKIDILINNAGFGLLRSLEQSTMSEIKEVMDVNFYGVIRCIQAVLPSMRAHKEGQIITLTSVGGLVGQPLNEVYCAAKFAVEGLIESMATYLEPFFGIRMTLIEPAGIRTEFINRVRTDLINNAQEQTDDPVTLAYAPILNGYLEAVQQRGTFSQNSQSALEVAEIITECALNPKTPLRVQTSQIAREICKEKLATDPTGEILQAKVRQRSFESTCVDGVTP